MPLGREVGLRPSDIVLDGDPAPAREKGTAAPLFSAHVYCGHGRGRPSQLLLSSCLWPYIFSCCGFFFVFFISSPNLSGRRLDISKFYPQILSSEASFYIYGRPLTDTM